MKNEKQGAVFIVGMNGSGTTMLADCLTRHPELYIFPEETKVLPYFISKIDSYGDLQKLQPRKKLADDLGRCWAYWDINGMKPVRLDEHMLEEPGFCGVLDALYGHFASREGKRRWGEKTPMYVQHMTLLARHIPHAKFIHIYRDGRDVAQSFHRRFGRQPMHTIYRWKKIVGMGFEQGRQLGASYYLELSYESLTSKPERYLREICSFLGLPFHSDVLKSSMPYLLRAKTVKEQGRIVRNSEKWRSYFKAGEIEKLERIAGEFLGEHGYDVAISAGNHDPSKWRLRYWHIRDIVMNTLNHFKRNGIREILSLYRRMKLAVIQAMTNRY